MQQKNVKWIIIGVILALVFIGAATAAHCQDKVEVSRQFVEDANKAFDLVVEQRATIQKFLEERAATDVERAAAVKMKEAYDNLLAVRDQTDAAKDRLIEVYKKMLDLQTQMIDQLAKQLNKPRSTLDKFLNGLKEVLKAGVYILAGRALGS